MKLADLSTGKSGIVVKVLGTGKFRKRIIEMGFVKGKHVEVLANAPLRDPIQYKIMDYEVSLRRAEAELIEIITQDEAHANPATQNDFFGIVEDEWERTAIKREKHINVALIGNPNAGKTSLFNQITGQHQHVGNYSGITVDAKEGLNNHNGYQFHIFDLPGTYSLSAYSPEEMYVRKHIVEQKPDVIINLVSASNLERNLYLTTQLIDMDIPMVIALNMYDELQKSGNQFDHQALAAMIGVPIVPTVSNKSSQLLGQTELLEQVIEVYEGRHPVSRHIHINHGGDLQHAIDHINTLIKQATNFQSGISGRFFAIKLLENDNDALEYIRHLSNADEILPYYEKVKTHIEKELNTDCESAVINAKYGFIEGALTETYQESSKDTLQFTRILDKIVTHRIWGYPIFLFFMWLMFECTFTLGAYPQDWIEQGVAALNQWIGSLLPAGPLTSLLCDGVISGVGGVLVFLPNILILYFFISLLEDLGYLARAAFIMDKIMHKMGLHGKSFVPMIMGFGCNVPAIMATRTLESKGNRLVTMLIIPFVSCSARLPVFILFSAIFFPAYAAWVTFALYLIGILVAVISARILRKWVVNEADVPFVMELPPYRIPTLGSIVHHMWEKSVEYLKKMGTFILFASIIVWALGYFPLSSHDQPTPSEQLEHSYIGKMGHAIEPIIEPLGFNWKMGIGVLTGLPAKELVVSTLNVLYANENSDEVDTETSTLPAQLKADTHADGTLVYTTPAVWAFLLFILLSCPCLATIIAIKNEAGSWKWALFSIVQTTLTAYLIALLVYQLGSLL